MLTATCFVLSVAGCDKLEDFGDTNVNPGAATEPVIGGLLTNVQANIGSYAYDTRGGLYAQIFSETQYTDVSLYGRPELAFTDYYRLYLNDLQNIINTGESNNMTQISRILQQYIFFVLTNLWGDVPYGEALQGDVNLQPRYDRQEDIYRGIFQTLGEAVDSFDDSAITGDIIFGGDVDAWRRAANSLKLVAAIQLSKAVPTADGFAAEAFREALAATGGVITTNAQNFQVNYPGGNFQSPYFTRYLTRQDYAESEPLVSLLLELEDTRQSVYGSSNVGMPYGLPRTGAEGSEAFTSANPNWSRIFSEDARPEDGSVYIITAAQVALARAEASDLGWTTENLSDLYTTGIELSHAQWGVDMSAGYLTGDGVALTAVAGSGANVAQISIQRYIASYPDGTQAWSIWRKSGYPVLTPTPHATSETGEIPRRYIYATAEFSTNRASVEEAIANLPGGNTAEARVWWDQE
ncbi:SusD/RagB family nutrient-binding outer membrane lipoprotein [Parapedobacter koreensis]|nr:SusD/RagB family nutrient-binding outer membrane lipoprotein [Parapedobacter koreensis]